MLCVQHSELCCQAVSAVFQGQLPMMSRYPPARQVHVFVHDVTMSVLLSRPLTRPPAPRRGAGTRLISHTIQSIQHGHVCGQSLLSDHIT